MHSTSIAVAVALLAAAHARAKIIEIDVGKGGLVFSSSSTTAAVGDTLEFHFFGSFHTAVQGDFSKPCQRLSGGFSSGHVNNKADGTPSVFQVTVKDTNPIWFYCSTPSHCQSGMAGVINPSASGSETLAAYQANAAGTTSSETSGSVAGGQVVSVGTLPSSAAAGSASSSTAPVSSTAASSTAASTASTASSGSGSGSGSSSSTQAVVATTTAAGTATSVASAASSASAAATSAKSSGASGPRGGVFVAQTGPTLAGVALGLGFLVYFMV